MNCGYCGKEMKDHWTFCMYCGTRVEQEQAEASPSRSSVYDVWATQVSGAPEEMAAEPENQETVFDIWAPKLQKQEKAAPAVREPEPRAPEAACPQGRKISIDPDKFEFHPEQRDEPIPRGVSSWELVPADTVAPRIQLPTRRGLGKMFFLGLITLGIYPMVIYSRIVTELNIAASRYDGKRTVSFLGMAMLSPLTLGIYAFVWYHNFCARIGEELQRRGVGYKFGPSQFWLWNILGSFILVGPFVFLHKLMKSMNLINKDFNEKG